MVGRYAELWVIQVAETIGIRVMLTLVHCSLSIIARFSADYAPYTVLVI